MRLVLFALCALAALCAAHPRGVQHSTTELISLGVSHEPAANGTAWAMLSLKSAELNFGDNLRVLFQRVMKENATARARDFIGLYFSEDAHVDDPWNWESVDPNKETDTVEMDANKSGDMEVRLVRPPNRILARLRVKVHKPCNPLCHLHGACVKGECVCHPGYMLPTCTSFDPEGLVLEAFDENGDKEMQVGLPIVAHVSHTFHLESNGKDYVGVYPHKSENGTAALSWKPLPRGNLTTVKLNPIKQPGEYVLRLTRFDDLHVVAESKPFSVYEYCPHQCTGHGKCVSGKCVCDEGWSAADCSVGPGMVTLEVLVNTTDGLLRKNQLVRVAFTRQFNAEFPDLMSDSDWIGMYAPGDNSTDPFAYQYAQMDPSTAADEEQQGEVLFMIPPFGSAYQFKYVRNDRKIMASTEPARVFQPCNPADCNQRGECVEGQCVCESGWKGAACDVGDVECRLTVNADNVLAGKPLSVSLERGANEGSPYDFVGLYNTSSVDNTEGLYAWVGVNNTRASGDAPNKATTTVHLVPPMAGGFGLRLVDIHTQETLCATPSFQVYASCPLDCSDHGVCFRGDCQCTEGWMEPDCKRKVGQMIINAPAKVVLGNNLYERTNFTASLSVPEGWYNPGDLVGVYPTPKDVAVPVDPTMILSYQVAPATPGESLVELSISNALGFGKYRLWYLNGQTYSKIEESDEFEVVPDCNDGAYDLAQAKCVCPESKAGPRCEADTCCYEFNPSTTRGHPGDTITVKWTRPNKSGHDADIIGLYLNNATDYSAPYAYQFAAGNGTNSGEVELLLPALEETYALHYISSVDMTSQEKGPMVYITIPCDPLDCSGHGVCLGGKCTCSSGYGGSRCDKVVPDLPSVVVESPGAIAAGSVFDVRWERPSDVGEHGDFIGIYKRFEQSSKPFAYTFVPVDPETFQGTVQVTAPQDAGIFQARWVSAKSGEVIASSAEFDVE